MMLPWIKWDESPQLGTTSASRTRLEHVAEAHFSGHGETLAAPEVKHLRTYVQKHLSEHRTSEWAHSCSYLLLETTSLLNAFWLVDSNITFQKVEDDPISNFLGNDIPIFHSSVFCGV